MKWSLWTTLLPVALCAIVTTLNSFVMSIYLKDWCQKRGLNVSDQILLSMLLTSTGLQWAMTLTSITFFLSTCMDVPVEGYLCIFVISFSLIEVSFWQMALLSMYYCVKLLHFTLSFFRWVKQLISGSTTQLLLISAGICLAINVPFLWVVHFERHYNVTVDRTEAYTFHMNIYYSMVIMALGCCLPFAITFICIVLSVGSLIRHIWRIRRNIPEFSSCPQLGGHIRAAGTMVFCIVLDLSFCLTITSLLSSSFSSGEIRDAIHWAMVSSYATIRSIILIFGNPQLRRRMLETCAFPTLVM